jgi:hypothetical protein
MAFLFLFTMARGKEGVILVSGGLCFTNKFLVYFFGRSLDTVVVAALGPHEHAALGRLGFIYPKGLRVWLDHVVMNIKVFSILHKELVCHVCNSTVTATQCP